MLRYFIFFLLCCCGKETLNNSPSTPQAGCSQDSECDVAKGELCQFGECIDMACKGAQTPLLIAAPRLLDFGEAPTSAEVTPLQKTVELRNAGQCVLTVEGITLTQQSNPGFGCSACEASQYPQRIAPGGILNVQTIFKALSPGEALGQLQIRSDDEIAPLLTIDLKANYKGKPLLVVSPTQLNFGYVAYVLGQNNTSEVQTVRISNQGSLTAPLEVTYVFVENGPFIITDENVRRISPVNAKTLIRDSNSFIDVPLVYTPQSFSAANARLIVAARAGSENFQVEVALQGSSLGPPKITVTPESLEFTKRNGQALQIGETECRSLDIANIGQSALLISQLQLVDASGDFSLRRTEVPALPPGAHQALDICYTPSGPSDAAHPDNPTRALQAVLNILNNDPTRSAVPVILKGYALQQQSDDILKLEMTFENAGNSWASSDFRNVDLILESPSGYVCTKPLQHFAPNGSGGYTLIGTDDYCADWTTSRTAGTAKWFSLGVYEEPERILVNGLGGSTGAGEYSVSVQYQEDCANMPTAALANVLGVSTDVLLAILGLSTGVLIPIDPSGISDVIASSCFDHASTLASVKISINGTEVAVPQKRLSRKGDLVEVARLIRRNGRFEVLR